MGRPRKPIDPERVFKLGRLGCTDEEIADILGCHRHTLERRFGTQLARARACRKMSLRRAQTIRAVRDRSDTMLIHLGKIELGQGAGGGGGDAREILARILADASGGSAEGAGPLPQ